MHKEQQSHISEKKQTRVFFTLYTSLFILFLRRDMRANCMTTCCMIKAASISDKT